MASATPNDRLTHRLHALGHDFVQHYWACREVDAKLLEELRGMPWSDRVHYHFSDHDKRADVNKILSVYQSGRHVYTCGPERFMDAVMEAAERQGLPQEAIHLE